VNWKKLLEELLGGGVSSAKKAAFETIDRAKLGVEEATKRVLKAASIFVLIILGLIFVLVGLANYLDAINNWISGVGLMIVGGVIILLMIVVSWFKK